MTAVELTEYEEYQAAGRIWGLVPRERISKIKFPRVPQATIKRYPTLLSALLGDRHQAHVTTAALMDRFSRIDGQPVPWWQSAGRCAPR